MAIAFSAVAGAQGANNTASVTAPAHASGDLLILVVSKDISGDGAPNFPAGFTSDANLTNTGPDTQQFYVGHKVADGSETTLNVTWMGSSRDWRIACLVYTGVDTTTPLDIAVPAGATNNSSNASPMTVTHATLTTATDGAVVVWLVGLDTVNSSVSVSGTPPTGYTQRHAEGHTAGWAGIYVADHTYATAGATGSIAGSVSVSSGNSGWAVVALPLRPAAGGGGGDISGATSATFSTAGALTGSGALSGASAPQFTTAGTLTGTGALTGTTAPAFSLTASLAGSGALSGASAPSFATAGTLTGLGDGAVSGTITAAFSTAGSLIGQGALAGLSAAVFAPSGAVTGAGALSATSTPTFSLSAALTAQGALATASSLAFSPAGALTAVGVLAAASDLTFALSGSLGALGSPDISGVISLGFSASADLTGSAPLIGATSIALSASGAALGQGLLSGAASIALSDIGTLQGAGVLAGTSVLAFTASALHVGGFEARVVFDAINVQSGFFEARSSSSSYFEPLN